MTEPRDSLLVRHRVLLLVVLGILAYVAWLGRRDFWYPDEPDIAEVARAMYLSGDWIAPRFHGEIWVDYPPMIYWGACLASHLLGGMSEFAFRLPSALAAVGLVVATCIFTSRWFGPRAGLWAGLLLLASSQFGWQAVGYRTDMLFSLFIGLGMFKYASGCGERARWGPRVAGFALLGLAMLTKGPLGLLLPGLVLTLWHGGRALFRTVKKRPGSWEEWRRLLELAPLTLVALAIYLPWFISCARAMGAEDILAELYRQNFRRFQEGSWGHGRPWYYYVTRIWGDLAPWMIFLPFAIWHILQKRLWRDRYVQLALWWFGAFLVFLSMAATKRQLYMLPAYPAVAIILARWLSAVGQTEAGLSEMPDPPLAFWRRLPLLARRWLELWIPLIIDAAPRYFVAILCIGFLLTPLVAVVAAVAMGPIAGKLELDELSRQILLDLRAPILALGAAGLAAGLWVWRTWRRGDLQASLLRLALAHVLVFVVFIAWFIPTLNPAKSYRPQCRWIREQIGAETKIGMLDLNAGKRKRGAFVYYGNFQVDSLESEGEMERFLREHPKSLVLVNARIDDQFFKTSGKNWRSRVIKEDLVAGRYSYVVLGNPEKK